jgi:hypothetical protein
MDVRYTFPNQYTADKKYKKFLSSQRTASSIHNALRTTNVEVTLRVEPISSPSLITARRQNTENCLALCRTPPSFPHPHLPSLTCLSFDSFGNKNQEKDESVITPRFDSLESFKAGDAHRRDATAVRCRDDELVIRRALARLHCGGDHRGVAAQHVEFEKAKFETSFSLYRLKG